MQHDFNGKTVVVTGACGNLGRAVVDKLAASGAQIALVDVSAERIQSVVAALPAEQQARCAGFAADLSSADAVDGLVRDIVIRFGRIDALAHTVGGFAMGDPVHKGNLAVLEKMLALNVTPVYLMGGAVARQMLAQGGGGSLVFVLARSGQKGAKHQAAYVASKAAAIRIMESMALELRDDRIRVNGVSPSIIDTPPNRESMPNADFSKWVTPAQIADAILFLCSDAASGVYGANLDVFGQS